MRSRFLVTVAAVGVLGLSACGSDGKASTTLAVPASTGAAGASFNDADVAFAQGMIPHHQQAIQMADMALDPAVGASTQVQALATQIESGQGPEIDMMSGWLTTWGRPMQMDMGGSDMSAMNGMMSTQEMDTLGKMTGAEFDKMWMEMMIRHHEGAIAMAQTAKTSGSSTEVMAMSDQVISAQQAEIAQMQALLG